MKTIHPAPRDFSPIRLNDGPPTPPELAPGEHEVTILALVIVPLDPSVIWPEHASIPLPIIGVSITVESAAGGRYLATRFFVGADAITQYTRYILPLLGTEAMQRGDNPQAAVGTKAVLSISGEGESRRAELRAL